MTANRAVCGYTRKQTLPQLPRVSVLNIQQSFIVPTTCQTSQSGYVFSRRHSGILSYFYQRAGLGISCGLCSVKTVLVGMRILLSEDNSRGMSGHVFLGGRYHLSVVC